MQSLLYTIFVLCQIEEYSYYSLDASLESNVLVDKKVLEIVNKIKSKPNT